METRLLDTPFRVQELSLERQENVCLGFMFGNIRIKTQSLHKQRKVTQVFTA